MNERLNQFLDHSKEDILNDLKQLVSIPSVSGQEKPVKEALLWVVERASEMGLEAKTVLNDRVGVIELGEGSETVGVLAHVDVVAADDPENWSVPPFEGMIRDNCVWGRGVMDDKGPVISVLYGLLGLKSLGLPFHKKIQMIIGTQEETVWDDMTAYVDAFQLPDYGFTPDGEFPIQNIEKGYADAVLTFVSEGSEEESSDSPYELEILNLSGGTAVNVIPGKAVAEVRCEEALLLKHLEAFRRETGVRKLVAEKVDTYFIIKAEGISTHSGYPEKGENAISILCSFLSKFALMQNGLGQAAMLIDQYFSGDIYLKKFGLYRENDFLNGEYIHRTVGSPTIVSTEEKTCTLTINFRTAYGIFKRDVLTAFETCRTKYGFSVELRDCLEPTYMSKDHPFLTAMSESYEEETGLQDKFTLAYGTSYAKAMKDTVSFGPLFPGETDYCHEVDERVDIDSLMKAAKIYANTLEKTVFSSQSLQHILKEEN